MSRDLIIKLFSESKANCSNFIICHGAWYHGVLILGDFHFLYVFLTNVIAQESRVSKFLSAVTAGICFHLLVNGFYVNI